MEGDGIDRHWGFYWPPLKAGDAEGVVESLVTCKTKSWLSHFQNSDSVDSHAMDTLSHPNSNMIFLKLNLNLKYWV